MNCIHYWTEGEPCPQCTAEKRIRELEAELALARIALLGFNSEVERLKKYLNEVGSGSAFEDPGGGRESGDTSAQTRRPDNELVSSKGRSASVDDVGSVAAANPATCPSCGRPCERRELGHAGPHIHFDGVRDRFHHWDREPVERECGI